ncbi:MAG: 6-hydroxymethylpterin diphosphokinase MptE-like protein [Rhodospirillales bacterium]
MQDAEILFEKNLAAFKQHNPHVHKYLVGHRPVSKLVFDESGNPEILKNGNAVFGYRARAHADALVQKFKDFPTTIALTPPELGRFDRFGNRFLKKLLIQARTNAISFAKGAPNGQCFFFLIFGIDLGLHIDPLVDAVSPVFLQIIDPDLDNLHHSLHVYPWHALFERMEKGGGGVFVTIDEPIDIVMNQIQRVVTEHNPAAFDGTKIFTYGDPERAQAVAQSLLLNAPLMYLPGFMLDETLMMKNSYLNLHNPPNRIFVRTEEPVLSTPVFVVGAGPSLDDDLDFIKKHADSAIIITTGTAIRSMLVNGIVPDFHVEMENIHVFSSINQLAREFDLSPVCLVTTTSIEPHIVPFFDNVIYYFREGISPHPLYCRNERQSLRVSGPLVVNASFSLALDIGASEIYMLGTDFGSRGDGLDHARDNVLFTDNAIVGYTRKYETRVPANFEGQFFASEDFLSGLKVIRETIAFFGADRRIVNCSNGARVEGAKPIRSGELQLKGSPEAKRHDLTRVSERTVVMDSDWFRASWNESRLIEEIERFVTRAKELLGNPDAYTDLRYLLAFMELTNRTVEYTMADSKLALNSSAAAIIVMFRGTLDSILICVRHYLGRIDDHDKRRLLGSFIANELAGILDEMRDMALATINDPSAILPAKAGGDWEKEDFVQEAYYTWGNVSRNADCPCGSGKRYKHCHGQLS